MIDDLFVDMIRTIELLKPNMKHILHAYYFFYAWMLFMLRLHDFSG